MTDCPLPEPTAFPEFDRPMRYVRSAFLILVSLSSASGCTSGSPAEDLNARPGRLSIAGLGATLGAVLGSDTGKSLDERDRALSADAEYDALQYRQAGVAREWRNSQSGHSGAVTPGPAYSVNNYTCRDYTHRITIGAKTEVVRSTACRQPDGSWRPLG